MRNIAAMRRSALLVLFLLFLAVSARPQETGSIHYNLEIIPRSDRTDFAISVSYRPAELNTTTVGLPTDYYGTPSIYKSVVSIEGTNGTVVKDSAKPAERIVEPNNEGVASLRYVISYDPEEMDNSAFGPKVAAGFFHLAGCQWLLHIGDDETPRKVTGEIAAAPEGWTLYSSLTKDPRKFETVATYFDLVPTAIGGGLDVRTFAVKERPVSVFVQGKFDISKDRIHKAVESIVRLQRNWFEFFDQPFFNVTINQRRNVIAGTAIDNLFVCFVNSAVTEEELKIAVAHEMFHYWLPTRMQIRIADGDEDIRHHWFSEGFTEYLSKKLLMEEGLISKAKFLESVNRDIYNLADSPARSLGHRELAAKIKAGTFRQEDKKVSYYRGVLIAMRWEASIRGMGGGKSLGDLIRRLFRHFEKNGGELDEDDFFVFVKDYGIDVERDFNEFILQGRPIRLEPDVLGNGIAGEEKEIPSFDPGLDLITTLRNKVVSGVAKDGPAFEAGLRDGMELVSTGNSNRFSNAWDAAAPLTLIVRIDGKERTLSYFPRGKLMKVMQFTEK